MYVFKCDCMIQTAKNNDCVYTRCQSWGKISKRDFGQTRQIQRLSQQKQVPCENCRRISDSAGERIKTTEMMMMMMIITDDVRGQGHQARPPTTNTSSTSVVTPTSIGVTKTTTTSGGSKLS